MTDSNPRATRVFISCSPADAAVAQSVAEALSARSVEVLLDAPDVPEGADWRPRIAEMIDKADAVVVLISADTVASEICAFEIAHAAAQKKRLVPVLIDELPPGSAPQALDPTTFIPARDPDERKGAILAIDKAIETNSAWMREHTQLAEAANRWEAHRRHPATLLRGAALKEAERWIAEAPPAGPGAPAPTDLQQAFLRSSRRAIRASGRWRIAAVLLLAASVGGALYLVELDRQASIQKAREDAIAEAATAIGRLEDRLGAVDGVMARFFNPIGGPALPGVTRWDAGGARRRLAPYFAAQLRRELDALPLPLASDGAAPPFFEEASIDPAAVRAFYAALTQVRNATNGVFAALETVGSDGCAQAPGEDFYREQLVSVRIQTLRTGSEEAYLASAALLSGVEGGPAQLASAQEPLRFLEPIAAPTTDEERRALEERRLMRRAMMSKATKALQDVQQTVDAACHQNIKQERQASVAVKPGDPPHLWIAAARSLRQLGRPDEAIRTFEQFAEQFPTIFPEGMPAYLEAARAFTRDVANPNASGGLFVAGVEFGSAAWESGVQKGDIILVMNGEPIASANRYSEIMEEAPLGGRIPLQIVRRSRGGVGPYVGENLTLRVASPSGMLVRPI